MTVKEMMACECGEKGNLFTANGSFFWGHMCKKSGSFTTKPLPGLDWMKIYKREHELEEGFHYSNPPKPMVETGIGEIGQ